MQVYVHRRSGELSLDEEARQTADTQPGNLDVRVEKTLWTCMGVLDVLSPRTLLPPQSFSLSSKEKKKRATSVQKAEGRIFLWDGSLLLRPEVSSDTTPTDEQKQRATAVRRPRTWREEILLLSKKSPSLSLTHRSRRACGEKKTSSRQRNSSGRRKLEGGEEEKKKKSQKEEEERWPWCWVLLCTLWRWKKSSFRFSVQNGTTRRLPRKSFGEPRRAREVRGEVSEKKEETRHAGADRGACV